MAWRAGAVSIAAAAAVGSMPPRPLAAQARATVTTVVCAPGTVAPGDSAPAGLPGVVARGDSAAMPAMGAPRDSAAMPAMVAPTGPVVAAARPGACVTSLRIERSPVFDPGQGALFRFANAFHRTTRERVIRRELLLAQGQPFDSLRLAETARNLRALGIFRRVFVDAGPDSAGAGVAARVRTQDGWTLRPAASLTSSAGQSSWLLGVEETNFLGLGATAIAEFRRTPDRDAFLAIWRSPRLIRDRVGLAASWEERSDGRAVGVSGGVPFFAFTSRTQVELGLTDFSGTVLRFRDGDPRPAERLDRRFTLARLVAGRALRASPRGAVRAGLQAQLRRDDFVPQGALGPGPFPRSVTGAAGAWFSAERADFAVVRNVASILREEDVALGPSVRLGVLAAPRAFGYADDGAGLEASARLGTRIGAGYATVAAAAVGRLAGGLDSGTVRVAGTVALIPAARQALVLRAQAGWKRNPVPGEEFDVGLGFGPRAFPIHAFTGDRLVLLGAEHRWTLAEEAFGLLGLGVAAFGEWGGAWYGGQRRRTGGNAGMGLRWAFTRGSESGARRVDLVYRFANDRLPAGWSVVLGEGFAF